MGLVEDAVRAELVELKADGSALGASALMLAVSLDDAGNSLTSRSMAARELRETLGRVRVLAASRREPDKLDDLAERRRRRLAS